MTISHTCTFFTKEGCFSAKMRKRSRPRCLTGKTYSVRASFHDAPWPIDHFHRNKRTSGLFGKVCVSAEGRHGMRPVHHLLPCWAYVAVIKKSITKSQPFLDWGILLPFYLTNRTCQSRTCGYSATKLGYRVGTRREQTRPPMLLAAQVVHRFLVDARAASRNDTRG